MNLSLLNVASASAEKMKTRFNARIQSIKITPRRVFCQHLMFDNKQCEHDSGHSSSVSMLQKMLFGDAYQERNSHLFQQITTLDSILFAGRQLTSIILDQSFGLNFDPVFEVIYKYQSQIAELQNYDLFTVAAYHAIYSHVCHYFSIDDLYLQHHKNMQKLIKQYGSNPGDFYYGSIYENVLFGIPNNQNNADTNERFQDAAVINEMNRYFKKNFISYILKDIMVLSFLFQMAYYGYDFITLPTYPLIQAIKKAACCHFIHNADFEEINQLLDYKVCTWFEHYQRQDLYVDSDEQYKLEQGEFKLLVKNIIGDNVNHKENKVDSLFGYCKKKMIMYGHDTVKTVVQLPINATILGFDNQFTIIMSNSPNILFGTNSRYILLSNQAPDFTNIPSKHADRYHGCHAILVNGKKAMIYNFKNNKYHAFNHTYAIRYFHQNYQIWVETIVPNWHTHSDRYNATILAYSNKNVVEYHNMADHLQMGLQSLSYNPALVLAAIDYIKQANAANY